MLRIHDENGKDVTDIILLVETFGVSAVVAAIQELQKKKQDPANTDKCCEPTAEELALLAAGDCTPQELWGGSRPTCPKCIRKGD